MDVSGVAELKAIIRIRPFRRLWAVLGLSALGDWLGLLATATFASEQVSGSLAKGAAFGSVLQAAPALAAPDFAAAVKADYDKYEKVVKLAQARID